MHSGQKKSKYFQKINLTTVSSYRVFKELAFSRTVVKKDSNFFHRNVWRTVYLSEFRKKQWSERGQNIFRNQFEHCVFIWIQQVAFGTKYVNFRSSFVINVRSKEAGENLSQISVKMAKGSVKMFSENNSDHCIFIWSPQGAFSENFTLPLHKMAMYNGQKESKYVKKILLMLTDLKAKGTKWSAV